MKQEYNFMYSKQVINEDGETNQMCMFTLGTHFLHWLLMYQNSVKSLFFFFFFLKKKQKHLFVCLEKWLCHLFICGVYLFICLVHFRLCQVRQISWDAEIMLMGLPIKSLCLQQQVPCHHNKKKKNALQSCCIFDDKAALLSPPFLSVAVGEHADHSKVTQKRTLSVRTYSALVKHKINVLSLNTPPPHHPTSYPALCPYNYWGEPHPKQWMMGNAFVEVKWWKRKRERKKKWRKERG